MPVGLIFKQQLRLWLNELHNKMKWNVSKMKGKNNALPKLGFIQKNLFKFVGKN